MFIFLQNNIVYKTILLFTKESCEELIERKTNLNLILQDNLLYILVFSYNRIIFEYRSIESQFVGTRDAVNGETHPLLN